MPSLTVKDTVYLPAAVKVCVGLCNVLVLPSPKSQDHEEALPVDLSIKLTSSGKAPEVLLGENAAFNGAVEVNPGEVNWPRPNVPADISPSEFIANISTLTFASPSLEGFHVIDELVTSSETQTPTSVATATWLKLFLL